MKRCRLRLVLALALPAAAYGCGSDYPDTISRERFVEVNVALRTLEVPAADSAVADSRKAAADSAAKARADSARAAVLRKHGVTEKELRAFVDARRYDTEALAETWREIAERVARADSLARADSVRRDSLARKEPAAGGDTAASPAPPGTSAPDALPERRPRVPRQVKS